MRPKCALIYNENASGFNKKTFLEIIKSVYNSGYTPVPIESEYPEFIIDNIEEFNKEFNIILTLGGDGTVSYAYEAFHKLDGKQKATYGHIPSGTTNDMGENTYVPRYNAPKATKLLLNGSVENRDIIDINGHAIAYVAAGGILAPSTYLIDKSGDKKNAGTFSYIKYGLKSFFNDPEIYHSIARDPYEITVETSKDKYETKAIFFAIFNGKSFAHLRMHPNVNVCDGTFDFAIIHNTPELFKAVATSFVSPKGVMGLKNLTSTTDYLKIKFNNKTPFYPLNCDGDGRDLLNGSNTIEVKAKGKIKQLVRKK